MLLFRATCQLGTLWLLTGLLRTLKTTPTRWNPRVIPTSNRTALSTRYGGTRKTVETALFNAILAKFR